MANNDSDHQEKEIMVNISEIRRDGGTQMRPELNRDHIDQIKSAIERGITMPAVDLVYDGENYWLWNGFHRTEANLELNNKAILSKVRAGTRRDAVWLAAAANKENHSLPRVGGTLINCVRTILHDPEWLAEIRNEKMSRRALAAHIDCNEALVRRVLKEIEEEERQKQAKMTADVSAVDLGEETLEPPPIFPQEVVGRDGRVYNTSRLSQKKGSSGGGGGGGGGGGSSAGASTTTTTTTQSNNGRAAAAAPATVVSPPPKAKPVILPKRGDLMKYGKHVAFCGDSLTDSKLEEALPDSVDLCFTTLLFNDYTPQEYGWKCNRKLLEYAKLVVVLVQQADAVVDLVDEMGRNNLRYAIASILSRGTGASQWGWVGFFSKKNLDESQDFTEDAFASPNQLLRGIIETYCPKKAGVLVIDGPNMIGFNPLICCEETGRACFLIEPNMNALGEQITDYQIGFGNS